MAIISYHHLSSLFYRWRINGDHHLCHSRWMSNERIDLMIKTNFSQMSSGEEEEEEYENLRSRM